MTLFTVGFTRKPAARFFPLLADAGVARVLDVRLHNTSQLAGFAKRDDLRYLLHATHGIGYESIPELAPTAEMLDPYKKGGGSWDDYAPRYLDLLRERRVETLLDPERFDGGCLLCSEHEPHHCHRRLAAEYLAEKWCGLEIVHLV